MLSTTAIVMQPMDKRYVKACVFFSIFNNPGAISRNEDSKKSAIYLSNNFIK